MKALALAPSGSEEALEQKLRHLVAWSHADEHDAGRLIAIRTAVEEWLEERTPRGRRRARSADQPRDLTALVTGVF